MEGGSVRRSTRVRRSPPRLASELSEPQQQQKTPAKALRSLSKVAGGGPPNGFSVTPITTNSTVNNNSSSRRTRSKSLAQSIDLTGVSARATPVRIFSFNVFQCVYLLSLGFFLEKNCRQKGANRDKSEEAAASPHRFSSSTNRLED